MRFVIAKVVYINIILQFRKKLTIFLILKNLTLYRDISLTKFK